MEAFDWIFSHMAVNVRKNASRVHPSGFEKADTIAARQARQWLPRLTMRNHWMGVCAILPVDDEASRWSACLEKSMQRKCSRRIPYCAS